MIVRNIETKRIYEPAIAADGFRVLCDRLWPRGVKKEVAQIDAWPKAITPSTELRKWFHAEKSRLPEFGIRYKQELDSMRDQLIDLLGRSTDETITLVSAVKDINTGHVAVLKNYIESLIANLE